MTNRKAVLAAGLILPAALLGLLAVAGFSQQADDSLVGAVNSLSTRTITDAGGNRVTEVTLDGTYGQTTFTLDEKQYRAMFGDPNGGGGMRFDASKLGKEYSKYVQQTYGATDDEWKALAPRLRKVQSLTWQLASHGRSGRGKSGELTNFEKAWGALSAALKRKDAGLEEIKKLLQVVNDEEAKTRAELEKARKELKELLTLRQEASLVQQGFLE